MPQEPSWAVEEAGLGVGKERLQEEVVDQGSPAPRRQTGTSPTPVRDPAAQQQVSGRACKALLASRPELRLPFLLPRPSPHLHGKIVFHETGPW